MISVLYVDDEPALLELAQLFLESAGDLRVATATSAREALDSPQIHSCDLILSDYLMPGMDGIAFLKEVRKRFGDLPFILFTGRGREEVVIEAINNGVDFYLQKGGDPQSQFAELAHKIRQAVSRKQAEGALNESERRFRELADLLPQGIYEADIAGRVTYVNHYALELYGYTEEDIRSGINIIATIAPGDRERATRAFQQIAELGSNPNSGAEYQALRKDGSIFPVAVFSSPVLRNGRTTGVRGILMDVTGRRLAEEKFLESESRFAAFMDNLPVTAFIKDDQCTNLFVNTHMEDLFSARQWIGRSVRDIFPADAAEKMIADDLKVLQEGHLKTIETLQTKNGEIRTFETHKFRIDRENKSPLIGGFALDITEHRQAAEKIRESESRLRSFIETTRESVALVDEEGKVLEWNAGAEHISGIRKDEALGRYVWDLTFPLLPREQRTEERRAAMEREIRASLESGIPVFEGPRVIEAERPDGSRISTRQVIFPIKTDKGFRLGLIAQDITEERRSLKVPRESEEK